MFAIALIVSWLPYQLYVDATHEGLRFAIPYILKDGAVLAAGVGGGLILTAWLRWGGRPSATTGLLLLAGSFTWESGYWSGSRNVHYVADLLTGFGAGLTLPLAFWRLLPAMPSRNKVLLAAVAGLVGGGLIDRTVGVPLTDEFGDAVVLFICLPAVLIAPVVRRK